MTPAQAAKMKRNDWLLPIALGLILVAALSGLAHTGVVFAHPLLVLIFGCSMVWCLSFSSDRCASRRE